MKETSFKIDDLGETATVSGLDTSLARHPVKLESNGITWFGVVDDDGVALLTRQDLLKNR